MKNKYFEKISASFKQLSRVAKIILVTLLGAVLLCVVVYVAWLRYFADSLTAYVPSDTVFYARFNLPASRQSDGFDQLILKILSDNNLNELQIKDIKREIAVVGEIKDNKTQYAILLRTDYPNQLQQTLQAKNLSFKFLTSDTIVIAPSDNLSDFQKKSKSIFEEKYKKHFSILNSLSVYATKDFLSATSDSWAGLAQNFLTDNNSELYLSGKVRQGGLLLSNNKKISVPDVKVATTSDIFLSLNNPADFISLFNQKNSLTSDSAWNRQLLTWQNQYGLDFSNDWFKNINKLTLFATVKKEQSGWLPADYDWQLVLDFKTDLNASSTEQLENIIKLICAWHYPTPKTVVLDDNTFITELRPDIRKFDFIDKKGINSLVFGQKEVGIYYLATTSRLILASNEDMTRFGVNDGQKDYLRLRTQFLPKTGYVGGYLSGFDLAYLSDGGLFLK
ncbi:MAG: hypothetical protein WCP18_02065 [bacterium]